MPTCSKCGRTNREGARFCTYCSAALPSRPAPGQMMKGDSYRVVRSLGKGGMGAIHLVEDLGAFGRLRVLKEMLDYVSPTDYPDTASYQQAVQKARDRFKEEARTLAALHHPGIPDIIAYFSENDRNYIVMEYVEGRDLEQDLTHQDDQGHVIAGKAYPLEDVIRWGIQVCQVLEYLSRVQPDPVVHHDIKPANLILDSNSGQVRLVDFGTAKARLALQPAGTLGLQKSSVYGTVGYAPPEQYQARSEPRTDVYALAATLYHLLTDDDPRLHPYQFGRLPALPPGIRDLLLQALDQDVTRRPAAEQMRRGLEGLLAPAPKRVRPFRFRSGPEAKGLPDLVLLCDQHWDDALYHLYAGQFEPWLTDLGQSALAAEAARIRLAGGNQSVGLESLLQTTGLVAAPQPVVLPASLDFSLRQDESKTLVVQITNAGRGFLAGQVRSDVPWLSVTPASFEGNSATIRVTASPFNQAPRRAHQGCLEITGRGFRVPVPAVANVRAPTRSTRRMPRGLTFLLMLAVSTLAALLGWKIATELPLAYAYVSAWYLEALHVEMVRLAAVLGATTAIAGTLANTARRLAVNDRGGWRALGGGLIAGSFFSILGTWLGALLWVYVLRDVADVNYDLRDQAELICRVCLVGGTVLGAVYGITGPGESLLTRTLRVLLKLLLILFWILIGLIGGYAGFSIAKGQEWGQEGGMWAAIGVGAVVALLVVSALWRFVRDALKH